MIRNPKVDYRLSYYNALLHVGQHKQAIKYLDSTNHKLTYASKANLWRIHRDKYLYYLDFQRKLTKSNSYLDRMELILRKSSLAYPNEYVQTSFARGDLFFTEKNIPKLLKVIMMVDNLQSQIFIPVDFRSLQANWRTLNLDSLNLRMPLHI